MGIGDVVWLHDGSAALLVEEGEGEPGRYEGEGPQARWVDNPDYRPSLVARLTLETVEPAQYVGDKADTATAAREQAIADGTHSDRVDTQYVHEPATAAEQNHLAETPAVPGGAPVVSGDPLTPLSDAERTELEQLRAAQAATAAETVAEQQP